MTATERLRQLLDERGVKWWPLHDVESGYYEDRDTEFLANGRKHVAHEWGRRLQVDMLSPEQAVEATLGRGKCRMELPDLRGPAYTDVYVCSECGGEVMVGTVMGVSDVPKWCPWCGRKVDA